MQGTKNADGEGRRFLARASLSEVTRIMKEIFRYKGKHILYNTGEVEESDDEKFIVGESPGKKKKEEGLTSEQMGIVLGSMSDNRIADSVKDLVEKAAEEGADSLLTEEQRKIVSSSMSDNRISDSVRELVEQNAQ